MKLVDRWRNIDTAWKFAIGAYLVMRIALSVWAMLIASLLPTLTQNLDVFGTPVLASFDLRTSARYVYSRQIDSEWLTFRGGDEGYVVDTQTGSVWRLSDGRAVSGKFAGTMLMPSTYTVEDIFPYRGAAPEPNIFLALWQRFDTNWYLTLAERGYTGDDGSTVYFPLYPFLIHLFTAVTGNAMMAALLVSNVAAIGVLFLLFKIAATLDADSAKRTVVYLLIFPTGFFLLAGYTESLFLLWTLGAFIAGQNRRWWLAAILAALAALTRLQGVLLILPLAFLLWQQYRQAHSETRMARWLWRGIALALIPLATLGFLVFTNLSLLVSYEGQLHARFVFPWDNLLAALALFQAGRGTFIDALNILFTLVFGGMLIRVWQKLPREYFLYALAMYLAPLFRMTTEQSLVSMSRYVLAMFPVFMLWGQAGKNSWVNRAVLYLAFPLQLYLSAQFILWGWVA